MKSFLKALLCACVLLSSVRLTTAHAQGLRLGNIFVPDSSIEHGWDIGFRAHTNHLILIHPQARSRGPSGETPTSIRAAYNLPSTGGTGIIAIVDAYHYPTARNDFNTFSAQFGLPQETSTDPLASTNKVFQVVYASGSQPGVNASWTLEEALDIEWAHAMAPSAKIVLVEAASSSFNNLFAAVDKATQIVTAGGGNGEVSMSWGGSEFSGETSYDSHFTASGVVYFAASGDTGGATIYPGVSPNVVCAGGTTIHRDSSGNLTGETGWSGSGGGLSKYEPRPSYQSGIAAIMGNARGAPDFSFDADPNSGLSVYDTTRYEGYTGWWVVGGTSAASPALAGIVNLVGQFSSNSTAELTTIYSNLGNSSDFRDITSGAAGSFSCTTGWDFVTGVGSNRGLNGK